MAPAGLVALALVQIALAHTVALSPWKGGGFGMFATLDHGGFRSVRVVAVGPQGEQPIPLPADLRRLTLRVRDLPTHSGMLRLARAVAPRAPAGSALRVEVWRMEFAPDDLRPTWNRLAEALLENRP